MTLVKLRSLENPDDIIYVNPAHVCIVSPNLRHKGNSVLLFVNGFTQSVKGSPEQVAQTLDLGENPDEEIPF